LTRQLSRRTVGNSFSVNGFEVNIMRSPLTPLGRLADTMFRRRRLVVAGWLVLLVAAFGAAGQLGGEWSADYSTPGSESRAASDRLAERFPGQTGQTIDVVWTASDARAAGVRVAPLLADAQRLEGVGDGVTPRDARISPDGRTAMVRLPIDGRDAEDVPVQSGRELIALAERAEGDGLRVELGGIAIRNAEEAEASSESVGLLVAAAVLILTFGSIVAAGLPLATALFGLGVSSALIALLAALIDVPDWAPSVAAMIGIGVGIDYALLILTRFRASLDRGLAPREATVEAIATAGRSVLVAGTTVVISMLGLFLMGLTYLYGVALSASLAVLVVMAASVTLLPALLGFAGHGVNRLRIGRRRERTVKDPDATMAARWGRAVQRRPWTAVVAGVGILLVLAAPVTGLRLGFPDQGNDRAGTTTRAAYDLVAEGFGAGSAGPLLLVAEDPEPSQLDALVKDVRATDGVASVAPPVVNPAGDTAVIAVAPETKPQDAATADLVRELRAEHSVLVGGETASLVDQSDVTADRLPLFIGGVVGLSFLLLLFAFRAPLVAVKAAAMNLLSIGAAYGVVAAVADGGALGQLVGIDTATPVPPFIPVMMFAILFGLSMDYEVFLLSRIREEFLGHGDTSRAVTEGLARTARVITAAALIMVAVFGAFVLSGEVFLKLIGIGLATAVLVDATVVRMVLVPAVMQLLGDRNWWLPQWLDRLLPHAELEPASA
jgi:RND superfamily putative drug exporter